MTNVFVQPTYEGKQALLDAIDRDDVTALPSMIVAAALDEEDGSFVQDACIRLSCHENEFVRGNAILGFGHVARLFGALAESAVSIVRLGLADPSSYVRGQANAAASDLKHFLGIDVRSSLS